MKNYMISEELTNKIIAYLSEKPFKESAALIGEFMQLKGINIIPPTPEVKGGDNNVSNTETSSQEGNANGTQAQGEESNGEK